MNIFEENLRAAKSLSENPNSIINNSSVVAGSNTTANLENQKRSIISNSVNKPPPSTTPVVDSKPTEKPPYPNVLSQYTSYNYAFTLSVLSRDQINTSSYKRGDFGPLILRSASGAPDKDLVGTQYGQYEFYMDNLKIDSIIGLDKMSGNTNANKISFEVYEPYSMGLFFQTLQVAAKTSGYENYLDVPILLTIEFKGHIFDNDRQDTNVTIPNTKKYIPLKLRTAQMKVNGKGTSYSIDAYPWNEGAYSSQYNISKTDITIKCDKGNYTLQNLLQTGEQSLQAVLNNYFKERVKEDQTKVADEIAIIFPAELAAQKVNSPDEKSDQSATKSSTIKSGDSSVFKALGVIRGTGSNNSLIQDTSNGAAAVNKIGQSLLAFNELYKGDTPFPKDNVVYDEKTGIYKRGDITIDVKNSDFKFNQGSTVVDMINQVIMTSDYARNALTESQKNPQGQISWWKVETQLYMLQAAEGTTTGQIPKLAVFRVVPYLVDSQYIIPPNTKKPGINNLKRESLKEYNYIYTGKNTEILDWNIDFRAGFYLSLNADNTKNTAKSELAASTSPGANQNDLEAQKKSIISKSVAGASPSTQETPMSVKNDKIETRSSGQGGTSVPDEKTVAAKLFQDILLNGNDMIKLDLSILGDPYYIGDSGMGNYNAAPSPYQNLNSDGQMNYQNGQVVVTVNFRTPIDVNLETGFYNFGSDTKPVLQFSGLYLIQRVTHEFSRGKFKQNLNGFRIKGQDNPAAPEAEFVLNPETTTDAAAFNKQTNTNILAAITSGNNTNTKSPSVQTPGQSNQGVAKVLETQPFSIGTI
jgi:hypothetical protein